MSKDSVEHMIWLSSPISPCVSRLADALEVPLLLNDGVTRKGKEALAAEVAKGLAESRCSEQQYFSNF